MARVVVVSVAAGGGHKTAMVSIARTLSEHAPTLEVECFESTVESLDALHRNSYTFNEGFYDALYKAGDLKVVQDVSSVFLSSIVKEVADEFRPFMLSGNYDTIISTHFVQTFAMLKLREELGSSVKILAYIPDFDESTVHFAAYKGIRPDAAIAQSPRFLAKLNRRLGVPRNALHQAGYITRPEFTAARDITKEEALQRVAALPFTGASAIVPGKRTFVAAGGSFWVSEIYKEIKQLGESEDFQWDNAQILVVCGNNEEAYHDYMRLQEDLSAKNSAVCIVPLPFMNAEQLASVYRASDAVMLSGIAPATLYELIEAQAGQPVVRRVNPGPERFNLKYILDHNLALYAPESDDFLSLMTNFSQSPVLMDEYNYAHRLAAEQERAFAQRRAKSMATFIENLTTNNLSNGYRITPRYSLGSTLMRNFGKAGMRKSGIAAEYFSMLMSRSAPRSRRTT
jgi:UDP-N-acetylglucosamine:LPS N-acetylglucosamine transferase